MNAAADAAVVGPPFPHFRPSAAIPASPHHAHWQQNISIYPTTAFKQEEEYEEEFEDELEDEEEFEEEQEEGDFASADGEEDAAAEASGNGVGEEEEDVFVGSSSKPSRGASPRARLPCTRAAAAARPPRAGGVFVCRPTVGAAPRCLVPTTK